MKSLAAPLIVALVAACCALAIVAALTAMFGRGVFHVL